MTVEEFQLLIKEKNPPSGLDPLLLALWYDAKGDWEKSHGIIQEVDTRNAALIHAYLHRKEGDEWNADYWYARAKTTRVGQTIQDEWNFLVSKFILLSNQVSLD